MFIQLTAIEFLLCSILFWCSKAIAWSIIDLTYLAGEKVASKVKSMLSRKQKQEKIEPKVKVASKTKATKSKTTTTTKK